MKIYNGLLESHFVSNSDKNLFTVHNLPFLIEGDKWTFVDSVDDADIIPMLNNPIDNAQFEKARKVIKPHHILLWLCIYHIDDMFNTVEDNIRRTDLLSGLTNRVIIVHTNFNNRDPKSVLYDHMFNRQKLYMTDYREDFNLSDKVWTVFSKKEVYRLVPIKKTPVKQFLCMSRISGPSLYDPPRMYKRFLLKEILVNYNGYISTPEKGEIIYPNGLGAEADFMLSRGGTWFPAADHFYETSYVSIYVETVTYSYDVRLVSEKTFDPLIKGHFILPYGYQGLIKDIKAYGFKLPDWIDYSYDDIHDNDFRFEAYKKSMLDLLRLDVTDLHALYLKDKNILEHNRKVFFDRPYDTLHDKVVDAIKANGWNLPKTC